MHGGDLSSVHSLATTGAAPQEFVLVLAIFCFLSQTDMAGALDPEITRTFHLVRRLGACMRAAPCSARPHTAERRRDHTRNTAGCRRRSPSCSSTPRATATSRRCAALDAEPGLLRCGACALSQPARQAHAPFSRVRLREASARLCADSMWPRESMQRPEPRACQSCRSAGLLHARVTNWAGEREQEELLAALREPGDVAHHGQPRDGGASTAAHDLGKRFEEMDFDHDGVCL